VGQYYERPQNVKPKEPPISEFIGTPRTWSIPVTYELGARDPLSRRNLGLLCQSKILGLR